jgi:hypothetical protein
MRAWRFRVAVLERWAGHARYAVRPAATATAPSIASGATDASCDFDVLNGSETWSIMRLLQQRLPDESIGRFEVIDASRSLNGASIEI